MNSCLVGSVVLQGTIYENCRRSVLVFRGLCRTKTVYTLTCMCLGQCTPFLYYNENEKRSNIFYSWILLNGIRLVWFARWAGRRCTCAIKTQLDKFILVQHVWPTKNRPMKFHTLLKNGFRVLIIMCNHSSLCVCVCVWVLHLCKSHSV